MEIEKRLKKIPTDLLKEFYKKSVEFQKLEPWKWMDESNVFGVENPESKEIGYCSILGMAGKHFALAIYLGTEGLNSYKELYADAYQDEVERIISQLCLMIGFEHKDDLEEWDLVMLDKAGVKKPFKNKYPQSSKFTPSYLTQPMNKDEILFSTLAIEQAIIIAKKFKENNQILSSKSPQKYFVRVNGVSRNDWKTEWKMPNKIVKNKSHFLMDEVRAQKIKMKQYHQSGVWEMSVLHMPSPVTEKIPYYLPVVIIFAKEGDAPIIGSETLKSYNYKDNLIQALFNTIEKNNCIPTKIVTKRKDVFDIIEKAASTLSIDIEVVNDIPLSEHIVDGLKNNLLK